MKIKYFCLFLILLFSEISGMSQINRQILDLNLGTTTQSVAENTLKKLGYNFTPTSFSDILQCKNVSFGGYNWNICKLVFSKNKFSEIYLHKDFTDIKMASAVFENIRNMLMTKYKGKTSVLEDKFSEYGDSYEITDNNVMISLLCTKIEGVVISINLNYIYLPLRMNDKNSGYKDY